MKGWVYVITNKAMSNLVKVGFTLKDPDLRANELNHTGTPHPYVVEYEVLVDNPRDIEQATHKYLHSKKEGKEWFRCAPEEAIAWIKSAVGNKAYTENYKKADREYVEKIRQNKLHQLAENARAKEIVEQKELQKEVNLVSHKAKVAASQAAEAVRKAKQASKLANDCARVAVEESKKWFGGKEGYKVSNLLTTLLLQTCGHYEGQWQNGKENGHGVSYMSNGYRYEGEWRNGEHNGYGICVYANGDRYDGEWKNNKKNGYGVYLFRNGERYEGKFEGESFHDPHTLVNGYGIKTLSNGERQEGEWWCNRRKEGYGIDYRPDGSILRAGRFNFAGTLIESCSNSIETPGS